ncbi:MAG: ABC transporter ATP-binding protein [Nocardioidaceae bacterium]
MLRQVRHRNSWRFFGVLAKADRTLAYSWWSILMLRAMLPTGFAIAMGWLVGSVQGPHDLTGPLVLVGVVFVGLQVLAPLHQSVSANLGSRTAAWLFDELTEACVQPPGLGHLEDPQLGDDLSMARDFDLGHAGPPLALAMDFIAAGLVDLLSGATSAIVLTVYAWWAGLLLAAAWLSTQWLLRESGVWRDRNTDEVRAAQRQADYAYRLAVEPPPAKELRLFGLAGWTIERFARHRRRLFDLQWQATRMRERSVLTSLAVVAAANVFVFWTLAHQATTGSLGLDQIVVYVQVAIGTSLLAFGGLSWAMDGAAAPAAAVLRLREAMRPAGALRPVCAGAEPRSAQRLPQQGIRFRDVSFGYPGTGESVLAGFDLTIPAGSSLAIVGQNGAGKTTLAKLLCRLYDVDAGSIEIDGTDLRDLELLGWRSRLAAVFQDFIRFDLTLRDNIAPAGAPDDVVRAAAHEAGADRLASLDTVLSRGYDGGTDLSGGQWQRVALARALCAVRLGAGVVLLDEPTAQLDIRGESEVFDRILAATRDCTTILVSHRFSTVRHADRICVLEHGRVIELGSHDELMALGGRYCTMFDLQASRFRRDGGGRLAADSEEELDENGQEVHLDVL